MSGLDLVEALLRPKAVALIGASDTPGRLAARPQGFLRKHGFAGRVYPVNPRREAVQGEPAFPSVRDLPEPVDHAYVLLDTELAIRAVADCAAAGVRVVSVLADGFAESGPEGAERQRRLVAAAEAGGVALIGPNSTGVVGVRAGFACTSNAAFARAPLLCGGTAALSQSGSMIGAIQSRGTAIGRGFAAFVSVGNEASLGIGEIGRALVDDPEIEGFALFLETVRRREAFAGFARRAQAVGKPVAAYLVGRSKAGQALAESHTGAMIGGARALRAFLEDCGVVVVEGFETLIEIGPALALRPRLARRRRAATVVTTTGGGGAMVYDLIGGRGAALQGAPDAARAAAAEHGLTIKPGALVDVTFAGARYETMKAVMSALIADPETGLVVAAIGSSAEFNPELAVRPIVDAVAEGGAGGAPVLAAPLPNAPESLRLLNEGGVPAFRSVEAAAEAAALLLVEPRAPASGEAATLPEAARAALDALPEGLVHEAAAAGALRALGLRGPETLVVPASETTPAPEFGGPYALKALSPDLPHKSEVGAVRLGLADAAALGVALAEMRETLARRAPEARIEGFLAQRMEWGVGEAVVGFTRDPVAGPIITVGVGGVMTEIYGDVALRPAPVSPEEARAMLAGLRGLPLLAGFRGAAAGDLAALAEAVAALSRLALHPRVIEGEINPLLVRETGALTLDALLRMGPADRTDHFGEAGRT